MYKSKESIDREFDEVYKNPISNSWTENFTNKLKAFLHKTREEDRVATIEEVEDGTEKLLVVYADAFIHDFPDGHELISRKDVLDFLSNLKKTK